MGSGEKEMPGDPVEAAKWRVAKEAVTRHLHSGQPSLLAILGDPVEAAKWGVAKEVIGVGSGSTAKYLVDHMAEAFHSGKLARHLIISNGLPLSDLERHPELDIAIDGADEVDPYLHCIKGGGGCLTQEKIVQVCARKFVIIADHRKASSYLGENFPKLPIEVIQFAYNPVKNRIMNLYGGTCELRMASKKAGPVVTDNGCYILDWEFPRIGRSMDWAKVHADIKLIPGVVETGLFVGAAEQALFGQLDGSVLTWNRNTHNSTNNSAAVNDTSNATSNNGTTNDTNGHHH